MDTDDIIVIEVNTTVRLWCRNCRNFLKSFPSQNYISVNEIVDECSDITHECEDE